MSANLPFHYPEGTPGRVIGVALAIATGATVLSACSGPNQTTPHPQPSIAIQGTANLLDGEWGYMPGSQETPAGLVIENRDFEIVEQNGSGGQPNPPVNEYGTHLAVQGGFQVKAELKDMHGPASLRLYAKPPEVSDEFRVEPRSIAATVNGHQLTVNVWNGNGMQDLAHQRPVETEDYTIPGDDTDVHLSISDEGTQIVIGANGLNLGSMPSAGAFNSGQVWFGANAPSRRGRFLISKLSATALPGGQIKTVNVAAEQRMPKNPNGLQELTSKIRPGFLIGTDLATWAATSSSSYDKAVFEGNFGIVTPENAMKWQFVEPEPGVFDFHEADAIVAMAEKNGMQVHGHNLVFGEALPRWVRDLPTSTPEQKAYVKKVLYDHVYTMVSHFKGKVNEWDINEPFSYYDNNGNMPTDRFVDSVFYRAMGEDYIKVAADAATAANPDVHLWINDFGAENDTGAYWNGIFSTLKSLKSQGVNLYGFGFESHDYDPVYDDISNATNNQGINVLNDHMNELAGIGLKSRVSEFDAPAHDPGYAQDHSSQAAQMTGTLRTCLKNPNCVAFSTWSTGMTDIYQTGNYQLRQSVDSMFDLDNKPTNAYWDVQRMLRGMLRRLAA